MGPFSQPLPQLAGDFMVLENFVIIADPTTPICTYNPERFALIIAVSNSVLIHFATFHDASGQAGISCNNQDFTFRLNFRDVGPYVWSAFFSGGNAINQPYTVIEVIYRPR